MLGAPGTGKTTLAAELVSDAYAATLWPVLVIDSLGAISQSLSRDGTPNSLDDLGLTTCKTPSAAAHALIVEQRHALMVPRDADDVEAIVGALVAWRGGAVVLVDESSPWITSRRRSAALATACRLHRHAHLVVVLTTQHASGDVPAEMVSCEPSWYLFRSVSPTALAWVQKLGADPSQVRRLADREFVRLGRGSFAEDGSEALDGVGGEAEPTSSCRSSRLENSC